MGFLSSLGAYLLNPSKENEIRRKGEIGEARAAFGMFLYLPRRYKAFKDVLLPKNDGTTTQIDHIVVSNFGIFVIESKNISGSIYGAEYDKYWTICRGPSKYPLYNPLRQNAGHIKALAATTQLPEKYFHSIVFFCSEDCHFKTPMPENVRKSGLLDYILSKQRFLLSQGDVRAAIRAIKASRIASTRENQDAHVANVKRLLQGAR